MTAHRGQRGPAALAASLLAVLCGLGPSALGASETDLGRRTPGADESDVTEIGAPHPPELIAPGAASIHVPWDPELRVRVTDPERQDLNVSFHARPRTAPAEPFTFIHWSDTQHYSLEDPAIFEAMTRWIHGSAVERNIVFAPMSGDLVDHADQVIEWERADVAVRLLEPALAGYPDGIPFGVLPGNHDQFPREHADSTAAYNEYFGTARFAGRAYYGGSFDGAHNDYNFALFDAEGMGFVAVFIGFDPGANPAVLAWADNVLTAHADRRAIVVSHYLIGVGEQAPFGAQGQATYDALKHHQNLFLMLAGDAHGEGRRVDSFEGRQVHTLLANYQERPDSGQAWLRILEFRPAEDEIRVSTYSPWLDAFETDADSEFAIAYDLDLHRPFTRLGTVYGAASGAEVAWPWPERDPNTTYEWYVSVTDGCHVTRGPMWTFTTEREIGFSAYNDLAWSAGQLDVSISRITSPAGGSGLPSTGALVDHATGAPVTATLTVSGGAFDGLGHAGTGAEPPDTSDAHAAFGGRVNSVGNVSYVDEPDAPLVLAFAGLDTGHTYDLVFHAHRGAFGWDEASLVSLSGAPAFTNRSSHGIDDQMLPLFSGANDPSTRLPADNPSGWVAAFSDVVPGPDGAVVLTVAGDGIAGAENRGKYGGAVLLRQRLAHGNRAPTIEDPGDQTHGELEEVSVDLVAADPDGDDLLFACTGLPPGIDMDEMTGSVSGVVSAGAAAGSPYVVNVSVVDENEAEAWTGFIWWVSPEPPRRPDLEGVVAHSAHPNPFRPAVRFRLRSTDGSPVTLRIYDVGGRLVRELVAGGVLDGERVVVWDGRSGAGAAVGPGVYFYAIDVAGRRVATERLIRVR